MDTQIMEPVVNSKQSTNQCTFNLFSWKKGPDLCCAVPDFLPVPTFLDGDWRYEGTLSVNSRQPRGFDPAAAALGIRLFGFHLFQAAGPQSRSARAGGTKLDRQTPTCVETSLVPFRMAVPGAGSACSMSSTANSGGTWKESLYDALEDHERAEHLVAELE